MITMPERPVRGEFINFSASRHDRAVLRRLAGVEFDSCCAEHRGVWKWFRIADAFFL